MGHRHRRGSALAVLVGAPDVRTDDSQADQDARGHEEEGEHQRCVAGHVDLAGGPEADDDRCVHEARDHADDPDNRDRSDRQAREREDAVLEVPNPLAEAPSALPRRPRLPNVGNLDAPEAQPVEETDEARVRLVEEGELPGDVSRAREDVDTPGRDLGLNQTAVEPPEETRGDSSRRRVVPGGADTDRDIVVARMKRGEELLDERHGLLQIGGHDRDVLAACFSESRPDRVEGSEVPGQGDQLGREPTTSLQQIAKERERAVGRPVDDENRLEAAVETCGEVVQAIDEGGERVLVPVHRDHDGVSGSDVRAHEAPRIHDRPRCRSTRGSTGAVRTCSAACSVTGSRTPASSFSPQSGCRWSGIG